MYFNNNFKYLYGTKMIPKMYSKLFGLRTLNMTIGDRIKQLRGRESRDSFSNRFCVSKQTVVRYESGDTSPNADFISMICNSYGVTADWLVFGKDNANIQDVAIKSASLPEAIKSAPVPTTSPLPKSSILEEFPKQAIDKWLLEMPNGRFDDLWQEYRSSTKANQGWSQVEIVKRFPEFIEWIEDRFGLNDDDEDDKPSSLGHPHVHLEGEDDKDIESSFTNDFDILPRR
ncbi:hypothetical protein C4J81_03400 [Deltaproteobacteria bacterium Smac51]|nr:hypothetical protein C4J81_03400 [Deltaproteobacteria bacterium Smac51]